MYAPKIQRPSPTIHKPLIQTKTEPSDSGPRQSPVSEPDIASIRNQLAQLINANAPWPDIRKTATELLKRSATEDMASWYAELCFLHSGVDESSNAVRHYLSWYSPDFYFQIHPKIREKIALFFLTKGWMEILGTTIFNSHHQERLRPVERKIYFLWLSFFSWASQRK